MQTLWPIYKADCRSVVSPLSLPGVAHKDMTAELVASAKEVVQPFLLWGNVTK